MPEADDNTLLRHYAENHSEEAFATLVSRHINKVYSVALRHSRNPHEAEEITQAVFVILAKKARCLGKNVVLAGWLYEAARLTSITFLRGEIRRARREQEAHMQRILDEPASDQTWTQIAPLLDAAMARLNETDRHAVVLRFFDGKSMRETGAVLGATEDATKKRLHRALEKLRKFFAARGVSSTTAIIASAISSNSVQAAPTMLAQSVTAVAIAKGATASASTLTLAKGALKIMAGMNAKTAIVAAVAVLFLAGTTTITVREIQEHIRYPWQVPAVNLAMIRKFPVKNPPEAIIVPTIFQKESGGVGDYAPGGGTIGICQSVTDIVRIADAPNIYRMAFAPDLPGRRYDFFARGGNKDWGQDWGNALLAQLKSKVGVIEKPEIRNADVLLLEYKNPDAGGLRPPGSLLRSMGLDPRMRGMSGTNFFASFKSPISRLQGALQALLEVPVIDRSGLAGLYDFKLTYDEAPARYKESLKRALFDQLGFELVPTNMPYPMLVVEKAN